MLLIDGNFLEERCKRRISDEWNKKAAPSSWADAYEQFLTDIENCPPVDAVPVVRCRECKHLFVRGGSVTPNEDGTYSVYINARLSRQQNVDSLEHERNHMDHGDFGRELPVQKMEVEAG